MGRPFKNESFDFFIGNDQTKYLMTKVEVPKFVKRFYKENMNVDKKVKPPSWGYTDYVTNKPPPKGMKVTKEEPFTVQLVNKCPTCHKEGKPRMDRRSNDIDYHVYKKSKPPTTGRRDSYFVVYEHKTGGKTVRHSIVRFDENHGFFTKNGKLSTKLKDVLFPFCVKAMKNV